MVRDVTGQSNAVWSEEGQRPGCEAKAPSYDPYIALNAKVVSLPNKWKSTLLSPVSTFKSCCVSLGLS